MLSTMQPARASVVNRIFTPRSAFQNVGRGSLSRSPSCQRAVLLSISQGGGSRFNFRARDYTARRTCGIMHAVNEKCFVTTPVYYVNDKPHIGHVYTSTVADVYARFQRNMGKDVFFLTGTDEHGLKVEQSAEKRGVTTQQLADENSALFREVMEAMNISFSSFIRTTDASHKVQVQTLVEILLQKDFIYLGKFEGWYDEGQEEYYTAKEIGYKSPISGKDLIRSSEENYYFKLSAFQDQLLRFHEDNPTFLTPSSRRNEIIRRVEEGLNDVPVSRTNFTWGVPMPGDDTHVIYVWIDALLNYITALNLAEGPETNVGVSICHSEEGLKGYWPASLHVMAKEISWFHAVIWPALLLALELPLPERVHAHGFWIREGRKMSKSLGNFVDLEVMKRFSDHYGLDGFRYYLLTEGPVGSQDANFSASRVHEVYNTDLANTLGNSLSRTTAMVNKYYSDGAIPSEISTAGKRITWERFDWPELTAGAAADVMRHVEDLELPKATMAAIGIVARVDLFISETEPFRMAKDDLKAEELGAVLYQCLEALRIACVLLEPFIPEKIIEVGESMDLGTGSLLERVEWGGLKPGDKVKKMNIFPRVSPLNDQGLPLVG